jgi:CheY-like chemotaxis protein
MMRTEATEEFSDVPQADRHSHAMASVGCDLRFTYVNPAAERLFGAPRKTWLGRHLLEFEAVPPDARRAWARSCYTALKYARFVRQPLEFGVRRRCATLHICPQIAADGAVTGLLNIAEECAAVRDVAAPRLHAGADVYGARAEEDRVLAMLSHELRTPLNAILGWTQTLRSGMLREEAVGRALEQIEHSARTQARLLDELLGKWKAVKARRDARAGAGSGREITPRSTDPLSSLLERRALSGMRIVAVDDDANTREMLREALTRAGASVWCAANAQDGIQKVKRYHPDVLVSDIGMPGQDGLTLLRQIRVLPAEEGGMTPAIALTGYTDEADRSATRQVGYQAIATKPVNLADLLSTILSAAGQR